MTEPAHALHTLVELPASPPLPVAELHRRVAARRRHRRVSQGALAGVAAVLAGVAAVPLLDPPSEAPTQVVAAATGLPQVAQATANGSTLVLKADADCAYLQWADAQPGDATLAGGCGAPDTGHSVQTFGPPVRVNETLTAAILRGGPAMSRFSARLADGRMIDGALSAGGWAVVVADSRIIGVSGSDGIGVGVPEWIVR